MIQLIGKKVTFETPFELDGKPLVLQWRIPRPELWAEILAKWPVGDEITKEIDGKEVKEWKPRDWSNGDESIKICAWGLATKDFVKEKLREFWIDENKITFEDFIDSVWTSDDNIALKLLNTLRDKYSSSFRELGKNP